LKTIRISDAAHRELTRLLGEMMAKTGKPQTYNDAINALTAQSVIIPAELLAKIDAAINENKQLGYKTREQFIQDAIAALLQTISDSHKQEKPTKDHKNQEN
jgi:Arc/MetJ-type ribon-helix-helix transcriptional regulator